MISNNTSGGSVSNFMDNSVINSGNGASTGGIEKRSINHQPPPMPGTPRPQFNTDIVQPTVYATSLDKFHPSVTSLNSLLTGDNTTTNNSTVKQQHQQQLQQHQQENNKQLRDLLQRQGSNNDLLDRTENSLTSRSSQMNATAAATTTTTIIGQRWLSDSIIDTSNGSGNGTPNQQHDTMSFNTNTFREPFPVMTTTQQQLNKNQKPQSTSSNNNQQQQQQTQLISGSQYQNPNSPSVSIPPPSSPSQILSPSLGRVSFEQQQQQQHQQRIKRTPVRSTGQSPILTDDMKSPSSCSNIMPSSVGNECTNIQSPVGGVSSSTANVNIAAVNRQLKVKDDAKTTDGTEIPENVTTDLDKLEQEDNTAIGEVEGVGDILGGLGEDDDDELLNSLTAEMGEDFNILEYADPELDALTDSDNHNLFDKLDLDDGNDITTDERIKKLSSNEK